MKTLGRVLLWSFVLIGVLSVLGMVGLGVMVSQRAGKAPALPETITLTLDLRPGVSAAEPNSELTLLMLEGRTPVRWIVDGLDAAATDKRVKALLVRAGPTPMSFGHAEEIRAAIARFAETGKVTMAYATSFGVLGGGTLDYLVASSAREIWMQPTGEVGITGLNLSAPFLADGLDALGIVFDGGKRHEYKTGADALTDSAPSAAFLESTRSLVDGIGTATVAAMAASRGLEPDVVRALMDEAPLTPAHALEAGLVDKLAYWDEAVDALEATGSEPLDMAAYWLAHADQTADDAPDVALIYAAGPIFQGSSDTAPGTTTIGGDTLASILRDVAEDDDFAAAILRVDSPGGDYIASDEIWSATRLFQKAGKPLVVSMGAVAASGGYFIAMNADRIVALPGTLTGSIGVYGAKPVLSKLWDDLDITWSETSFGANAGIMSANKRFTPSQRAVFERWLDLVYEDFTTKVAIARGLDPKAMDSIARGRVWTGAQALDLGLVDGLGGLDEARAAVRVLLELPADAPLDVRMEPPMQTLEEALIAALLGEGLDDVAHTIGAAVFTPPHLPEALKPLLGAVQTGTSASVLQMPPLVIR